jgi:hypothetical protein
MLTEFHCNTEPIDKDLAESQSVLRAITRSDFIDGSFKLIRRSQRMVAARISFCLFHQSPQKVEKLYLTQGLPQFAHPRFSR